MLALAGTAAAPTGRRARPVFGRDTAAVSVAAGNLQHRRGAELRPRHAERHIVPGRGNQLCGWIAWALVFFQLSLWSLAAALVAAAWMLLPGAHARVITVLLGLMVCGSLWALRPPLCMGYYLLFWRGSTTDALHRTLQQETWGWGGIIHLVTRAEMIRVLLSCGADINARSSTAPLRAPPLFRQRRQEQLELQQHLTFIIQEQEGEQQQQQTPRGWWQFWAHQQHASGLSDGDAEDPLFATGVTPLMRAVVNEHVSYHLVHLLIDHGEYAADCCLPHFAGAAGVVVEPDAARA